MKPKLRLAKPVIEALTGPAGQTTKQGKPVKDESRFFFEPQGLGIRIDAAAVAGSLAGKTYFVQYSVNGTKRRMPIGACSAIDPATAKAKARAIIGRAALGFDPFDEAKQERAKAAGAAYTLAVLIDDCAKLHLGPNCSERYAHEGPRDLRRVFKDYLKKPAAELTPGMILRIHDQLAIDAPISAAQAVRVGKAVFNWAVKRKALTTNPFIGMPTAKQRSRDRVLEDEELVEILRVARAMGAFGTIVWLLALTGQRREEVAGMKWAELSPDLMTWTLPAKRAKNAKAHIVPLSAPAREILTTIGRESELVFPGLIGGGYNGWAKDKPRLDKASGVGTWVIHDLRRTMATNLQRLGVRLEVTESCLNHVSGSRSGIVGIYQRHEWKDEKRAALEAWGERVTALIEGRATAGNVVALRA
jgi:integrase